MQAKTEPALSQILESDLRSRNSGLVAGSSPRPSIDSDKSMKRSPGAGSHALAGLFLLASLYTAYFAATIVVPIVLAVLLFFLLSPAVERLVGWRVPRTVAAFLVVGVIVSTLVWSGYQTAGPAAEWLREAPATIQELRYKLRDGPNPLAQAREASVAVQEAVSEITGDNGPSADDAPAVKLSEPGYLDTVLQRTPIAMASFLIVAVLTLFLLISGDRLLRKITRLGASFGARRRIVRVTRQIEQEIGLYLGTVAVINAGLGLVVFGAMHLLGLPNPALWGALAAVLNFAPYAGAVITTGIILLVSVSTYDTFAEIMTAPLVFALITIIEGQIVTPLLLGKRMSLSPVVILLSVLVLGWLWGLPGALIAVPLATSLRIALLNSPRYRAIGELFAK